MLVYNLTSGPVVYKGRKLPPNGGSADIRDMSFIPNRDLELEKARILSFGKLPQWWLDEQSLKVVVVAVPVPAPVKILAAPVVVISTSPVDMEKPMSSKKK